MITVSHPDDRVRAITEKCRRFFASRRDRRIVASFLYGSVLTEAWRSDSDVDVAVLDQAQDRLPWSEQAVLMDELERVTGFPIDLRMVRDCLISHQALILTQGSSLWVSEPLILEAFRKSVLDDFHERSPNLHETWVTLLESLGGAARVPRDTD